ncbi:hypothetical protein [Klebsiella pneumoniae IS33]|nr:hypothetical protein [Klebsiella pneumoniae IS33]
MFVRARENLFFQARHDVRYPLSGANAPAATCAGVTTPLSSTQPLISQQA